VKVVCNVLNVEAGIVEDDSHFVFDLGAESTQSVQLVAAFEEEFNIEMDNEAALSVETVGDAVDFIEKYVNA
jgi:acyl carrier protein